MVEPVSEQGDDHEGQRHFDGHSLAAFICCGLPRGLVTSTTEI